MSLMKFLCDEHVPKGLQNAVTKLDSTINILLVGQAGGPAKTTTDPELLVWAESNHQALLTCDKSTLPGHLDAHVAAGKHTWGVFELRDGFSLGRLAQEILLLWSASSAEEWQVCYIFIPFS